MVEASIISLGWLEAISAIADLEQIAALHWLPEVRQQARAVVDVFKSDDPKTLLPERFLMNESIPFGSYSYGKRQITEQCRSQRWIWQGRPITQPRRPNTRRVSVPFDNGLLIGSDLGEWGGELTWKREDGNWSVNEVARMPYDAEALTKIDADLFAAWSGGRVVVFSDKDVLGLAACVP